MATLQQLSRLRRTFSVQSKSLPYSNTKFPKHGALNRSQRLQTLYRYHANISSSVWGHFAASGESTLRQVTTLGQRTAALAHPGSPKPLWGRKPQR